MYNLLIDTNVWLGLLENEKGNDIINALKMLVKEEQVRILVPPVIIKEWDKHSPKYTDFSEAAKRLTSPKQEAIYTSIIVKGAEQYKTQLADTIRRLISEQGTPVVRSDGASAEVTQRYEDCRAPFHNNRESISDAILYFSSIDWCRVNGMPELYFVTHNYKDFSITKDKKNVLHPDLICKGIRTNYYNDIGKLIHEIAPTVFSSLDTIQALAPKEPIRPPKVDINIPLLHQWKESFHYYFTQLPYIPRRLLAQVFPLLIAKDDSGGYSGSTLYINNPEICTLLEEHDVKPVKSSKDPHIITSELPLPEDLKYVLERLTSSLFDKIASSSSHNKYDCKIETYEVCDCLRCLYNRLEFKRLYALLPDVPTNDLDKDGKAGFVHFMLGNYKKAFQFFKVAEQLAKHQKLWVQQLVFAQNINESKRRISGTYDQELNIKDRNYHVDIDKIYLQNLQQDSFIKEASRLVYKNAYIADSYYRIAEYSEQIKEQYKSQLRGGVWHNNNIHLLNAVITEIKNFLSINNIINDYS